MTKLHIIIHNARMFVFLSCQSNSIEPLKVQQVIYMSLLLRVRTGGDYHLPSCNSTVRLTPSYINQKYRPID